MPEQEGFSKSVEVCNKVGTRWSRASFVKRSHLKRKLFSGPDLKTIDSEETGEDCWQESGNHGHEGHARRFAAGNSR